MKLELVKRRGKTLIRITVGGKSKAIQKAERKIRQRQLEIRNHFQKRLLEVENK